MDNIENFDIPEVTDSAIKVIGVGGGGGNAINHMFRQGIRDVNFVICNTDRQALQSSPVPVKVQLGSSLTEGRGAGNRPEVGREAALENIEDVKKVLSGNTKMVFITAGMGGGTGTGGAPVIAEACSQQGFVTVGIVTIPFRSEGKRRLKQAAEGINELEKHVDALLVINNERIRDMYGDFKISEAFSKADNVLAAAAKGIAEIITVPGYINVDFADVETVMRKSGMALMGTGVASGEDRADKAVEQALNSPLLNNNDIRGAKDVLLNITSGNAEVTMDEVTRIIEYLQNKAGFEADLIWGNGIDENLGDEISVTLIATGFGKSAFLNAGNEMTPERITLQVGSDVKDGNNKNLQSSASKTAGLKSNQKTFEFPGGRKKSDDFDEFEELYPETVKKRKFKEGNVKIDFDTVSEEELEELENVPAYERRQMRMNDPKLSGKLSNYSVTSKNKLSDRNSYLHDQVD